MVGHSSSSSSSDDSSREMATATTATAAVEGNSKLEESSAMIATATASPEEVDNRDDDAVQQQEEDLLPHILEAIDAQEWNTVLDCLERDPSLAKRQVSLVCQGENSKCLLVHLLSTGPMVAPVTVLEALVTLHPASLLQTDKRGNRLPLHLAMLTGASSTIIHYLCRARPQALRHPDQEGNYPLHYAAMYGNEDTIRLFVQSFPKACRITNGRDRLPLHLLCARCYDESPSLTSALQVLLQAYPEGLEVQDRFGRMPLHLAAQVRHYMQWDFLHKLVEVYPKALLHKDKSRQVPLQLARKSHCTQLRQQQDDLLLKALEEVTIAERRKAHPYRPFVGFIMPLPSPTTIVLGRRKGASHPDLYNCYG